MRGGTPNLKVILAVSLPLLASAVQWLLWNFLQPYAFILYYPTVYLSARLAGKRAGIAATLISALLLTFFFIPPQFSFSMTSVGSAVSVLVFTSIGFMFAYFQESLSWARSCEVDARTKALSSEEKLRETRIELLEMERRLAEEALLKSEERFFLAFSGNPAAIALTRLTDGMVLEVNETWQNLTGYRREEVLGKTARHIWPDAEAVRRFLDELHATGTIRGWEQDFLKKNGETFIAQLASQVLTVEGEQVILSTLVDITPLKRAEQALRESESRFRTIFDRAPLAIGIGAIEDGRLMEANPAWLRLLGFEREEAIGRSTVELGVWVDEGVRTEIVGEVRQGKGFSRDVLLRRKSGEVIDVLYSADMVVIDGRPCMLVMLNDITAVKSEEVRRNATVELLRICNEARDLDELMSRAAVFFRELSGCEAIGIRLRSGDDYPYCHSIGLPEEFVRADDSLCDRDAHGMPLKDVEGRPRLHCLCGEVIAGRCGEASCTPHGSYWTATGTGEVPKEAETHCHAQGYRSMALVPLRSHGERIGLFQFSDRRPGLVSAEKVALYEYLVDYIAISFSKLRADRALVEASQYNQQIIAGAQEGIIVYDRDLRYQVWNPYMERLTGVSAEEILGKKPQDFFPFLKETGVVDKLAQTLEGIESGSIEFPFTVELTGRTGWAADTRAPLRNTQGEIIGVIATVRDTTAERHLEEQLRQAQKMEAVGQLAGGVAHDFNNVLQVIMGYCSLLEADAMLDERQRGEVEQIMVSAERAAQLTRGLLAFSRRQVMEPKQVDLCGIVQHVQKFLVRIIGEDIALRVTQGEQALPVVADSGHIEQVLINLATNARDAMPKGGTLTLRTDLVELGEPMENQFGHAEPGRYARVTMADNGYGMDEETQDRLFEPFFTTKEVGKGTGLGMAIVYGIVKQHNGFINVYSEPGIGTTFRIYLPLAEESGGEGVGRAEPVPAPKGGSETLLLAEDDPEVRRLLVTVLTRFGYEVLEAEDGQRAVELFAADPDRVALVVMDLIMPRKNGMEAGGEIAQLKPGVKILYASGYTSDFMEQRGVSEQGIHLIMKPVQPVELLRKVRELLDR